MKSKAKTVYLDWIFRNKPNPVYPPDRQDKVKILMMFLHQDLSYRFFYRKALRKLDNGGSLIVFRPCQSLPGQAENAFVRLMGFKVEREYAVNDRWYLIHYRWVVLSN
jgi:hypothetical protein